MPTAQQQVTADIAAMQTARNDLNSANAIVTASKLTTAQKSAIHTQLATVAGVLQNAQTAAQAWLTANPTPPPPASLPGAPTGLSATPGTTNAALVWSAPSSNGGSAVTGYQLTLNGTVIVPNVVGLSYEFTTLLASTSYTVNVSAVNSVGVGPTASVSFTTEAVPPPPPPPPGGWVAPATPSLGNAATVIGSQNGTTDLLGATELSGITPSAYLSIWQGANPSVEFSGCAGASRYEVRDYDGVVISSGAITGASLTVAPPVGGWNYGWWRIYFFTTQAAGPMMASAVNLGWTSSILIIPADASMPPVVPAGYVDPGSNLWEAHALGYGVPRYSINDATNPAGDLTAISACIPAENEWWLKNYPDPARPHGMFVAFPNGTNSPAQLAGVTQVVAALYPLGVEFYEGPSNEPNMTSPGFGATCEAFATAVHAGNPNAKAMGPCVVGCNDPTTGIGGPWDTFLSGTPNAGNTLKLTSTAGPTGRPVTSVSGGGVANWAQVSSNPTTGVDIWQGTYEGPLANFTIDWSNVVNTEVEIQEYSPSGVLLDRWMIDLAGPGFATNTFALPAPGGGSYFDVISTHAYNSTGNDGLGQGRRNWADFRAILNAHGVTKPVWVTEYGTMQDVFSVFHPRRARTLLAFFLNCEEVGIPWSQVAYFYQQSHGFWAFPSWFENGNGSQLPSSGLMRTFAAEVWGKAFSKILSFGAPIDNEVMCDLFSGASGSTIVAVSPCPIPNTFVSFTVNTTAALALVDGWGNRSSATPASGVVTIPVYDVPSYLELPVGVTATPVHSTSGANLIAGATANSPLLTNGVYGPGSQYDGDPGPYIGTLVNPSAAAPDTSVWVDTPDTPIGRVVIHAGQVWQSNSTPVDFDLVDLAADKVLATVTSPIPPPLGYNSPNNDLGATADVFWTEPWIFDIKLASPVTTTKLGLAVRAVSSGGEPNAFCCNEPQIPAGVYIGQGDWTPRVCIDQIAAFAS